MPLRDLMEKIMNKLIVLSALTIITSGLTACGGVDEGEVNYDTVSECIIGEWDEKIVSPDLARRTLTYNFEPDGKVGITSKINSINESNFLTVAFTDSSFDIRLFLGLEVDLNFVLALLGGIPLDGYFYKSGTWQIDEETQELTVVLPSGSFTGYSMLSASGAESDFERRSDNVNSSSYTKFAHCDGNKLVVGAFKGDDSSIDGEWFGPESSTKVLTVNSSLNRATYEYLYTSGDYSSVEYSLYEMELTDSGYNVNECFAPFYDKSDETPITEYRCNDPAGTLNMGYGFIWSESDEYRTFPGMSVFSRQ